MKLESFQNICLLPTKMVKLTSNSTKLEIHGCGKFLYQLKKTTQVSHGIGRGQLPAPMLGRCRLLWFFGGLVEIEAA